VSSHGALKKRHLSAEPWPGVFPKVTPTSDVLSAV
jgi:hypothetical protein